MQSTNNAKSYCFGLMLAGFGLMNVAMFLHPMSPEDFLDLAIANPIGTLVDAQGYGVAIFFWIATLIFLYGFLALVKQSKFLRRLMPRSKLPVSISAT